MFSAPSNRHFQASAKRSLVAKESSSLACSAVGKIVVEGKLYSRNGAATENVRRCRRFIRASAAGLSHSRFIGAGLHLIARASEDAQARYCSKLYCHFYYFFASYSFDEFIISYRVDVWRISRLPL